MPNNHTVRRTRLAKPIKGLLPVEPVLPPSVELCKTAPIETAIQFLNQFVQEARKEIRQREKLTMKGNLTKTDCDSVSFLCDSFSLTIDFKGGITL